MEEQKDEKTKNVTEELVLYLFLGVFMIFTMILLLEQVNTLVNYYYYYLVIIIINVLINT